MVSKEVLDMLSGMEMDGRKRQREFMAKVFGAKIISTEEFAKLVKPPECIIWIDEVEEGF